MSTKKEKPHEVREVTPICIHGTVSPEISHTNVLNMRKVSRPATVTDAAGIVSPSSAGSATEYRYETGSWRETENTSCHLVELTVRKWGQHLPYGEWRCYWTHAHRRLEWQPSNYDRRRWRTLTLSGHRLSESRHKYNSTSLERPCGRVLRPFTDWRRLNISWTLNSFLKPFSARSRWLWLSTVSSWQFFA